MKRFTGTLFISDQMIKHIFFLWHILNTKSLAHSKLTIVGFLRRPFAILWYRSWHSSCRYNAYN